LINFNEVYKELRKARREGKLKRYFTYNFLKLPIGSLKKL